MTAVVQLSVMGGTLDDQLSWTPIAKPLRRAIINTMFSTSLSDGQFDSIDGLDAYFNDWYEEENNVAAGHVSVRTHREVLSIIIQLQTMSQTRSEMYSTLLQGDPTAEGKLLDASIDLAVRLWLTVSVGSIGQSLTPGKTLTWEKDKLQDTLHGNLWPPSQLDEKVKLPKTFTAANLEKIAGLKVIWTSNLADHLCLKDDDTKVMLYHQATFLELHKNSNSSIFPKDLVEETTRTLGLLIPSIDKKSKTWFQQKQKELDLDPKAGTYGPLNASSRQIEHFNYWRDRLIILKQTFDDVEPHSLSLLVFDDRKKVQWYTFWIAALVLLLTIVFGLVQSIAGVVQAWAAVRSMPPVRTI